MTKAFTWSFSKLNSFETCPKRHYEVDLTKHFVEAKSEQLNWGDEVHRVFKTTLSNPSNPPLPSEMQQYQKWIDAVRARPGTLLVEQKYALTKDLQPTGYFDANVWFRCIGDVVRINGPIGLVLDWKTGKIKVDSIQLMLTAQALFSFYPQLQRVCSEFVWLAEDVSTPEVYSRSDLQNAWIGLLGRVEAMEQASITQSYPPKPSGLCRKHCPVSSCPFFGRGNR